MTKFINTDLESESDSELECGTELEESQNLIMTLNNCNVFTHGNCVLHHIWLTDFEQVENLVVIFLTLNNSKSWQRFC